MLTQKNKRISIASEQEIAHLDKMMRSFNSDISAAMSYVRRAQGLSFKQLETRFSGRQGDTLKRYMHQSYSSMRPLHVVAAYSWITMVPMTAFFHGFKQNKFYKGMNDHLIAASVCMGLIPKEIFDAYLIMVTHLLDEDSRKKFMIFREHVESDFGEVENHIQLLPDVLDLDAFAIDYYRSIAITVRNFREENNIPFETMSNILQLSKYQYSLLENPNKTCYFPVSIGARIMKGFQLHSHVNFCSEMRQFPEFYKARQIQHSRIRESLIIEALKLLDQSKQKMMTQLLIDLSSIYR